MAIIYTYPKKSSVEANDTFIITDSGDNSTKVVTAQSLANYIDGTITLQEVLDTGNAAYYNAGGIPAQVGNSHITYHSTPNTTTIPPPTILTLNILTI